MSDIDQPPPYQPDGIPASPQQFGNEAFQQADMPDHADGKDDEAELPPPPYKPPVPIGPLISAAKVEPCIDGLESFDPILNNVDQALLFFSNYNYRPNLAIAIHGWHHRTVQGKRKKVTDFQYTIDISNYVLEGGIFDSRACVNRYVRSTNCLKRCRMIKQVALEWIVIRDSVVGHIRSYGYAHSLSVELRHRNNIVAINNSADCSRFLRNSCTTALCWLTCACLVWYPVKWCMQCRSDGDQDFTSTFTYGLSTLELIMRLKPAIRVRGRVNRYI